MPDERLLTETTAISAINYGYTFSRKHSKIDIKVKKNDRGELAFFTERNTRILSIK